MGLLEERGLFFKVKITGTRDNFGRKDYRVEPYSGTGERWVSDKHVQIIKG